MNIAKKILWCVVILAVLYGGVLVVERMTRQELTRVSHGQTGETVCLMWQPKLLRGNGVVALDLLNAQGKKIDSTQLQIFDTGFNALQQFGQVTFDDQGVVVSSLKTGEVVQRLAIKDGRLVKTD
jgi:hypothetical protein